MKQQIALITGANRGIGLAVAESLAKNGYLVILTARNKEKLEEACSIVTTSGGIADHYVLDVTDALQIKAVIDNIIAKYGHIDVLFNNAGVFITGTTNIDNNDIECVLQTNLIGAIFVAKEVALQMKKQKSGYIINLSSISGKGGAAAAGIYSASKYGLCGFNDSLAKEMSEFGVKVTALCPSVIATDMTQDFQMNQDDKIPTSDITKTVDYLLSLSPNTLPIEIVIDCTPLVGADNASVAQLVNAQ